MDHEETIDHIEMEMRWDRMSRRERAVLRQRHPELRELLDELERLRHLGRLRRRRLWLLAIAVIGLLALGYVVFHIYRGNSDLDQLPRRPQLEGIVPTSAVPCSRQATHQSQNLTHWSDFAGDRALPCRRASLHPYCKPSEAGAGGGPQAHSENAQWQTQMRFANFR